MQLFSAELKDVVCGDIVILTKGTFLCLANLHHSSKLILSDSNGDHFYHPYTPESRAVIDEFPIP